MNRRRRWSNYCEAVIRSGDCRVRICLHCSAVFDILAFAYTAYAVNHRNVHFSTFPIYVEISATAFYPVKNVRAIYERSCIGRRLAGRVRPYYCDSMSKDSQNVMQVRILSVCLELQLMCWVVGGCKWNYTQLSLSVK